MKNVVLTLLVALAIIMLVGCQQHVQTPEPPVFIEDSMKDEQESDINKEFVSDLLVAETVENQFEIIGRWSLDIYRTEAKNEKNLFETFGSGISSGWGMEILEDNSLSWWIAIGHGGAGVYHIAGNKIYAEIYTFEQSEPLRHEIEKFEDSTGEVYLVMNYYDYNNEFSYTLVWIRDDVVDICQTTPARAFERNLDNASEHILLSYFDNEPGSVFVQGDSVFIDRRSEWPQENSYPYKNLSDYLNVQDGTFVRSSNLAIMIFGEKVAETSIDGIRPLGRIFEDNYFHLIVNIRFFHDRDIPDAFARFIYSRDEHGNWVLKGGEEISRPPWLLESWSRN